MPLSNGNADFAGRGRKRPQLNLSVDRLHLDNKNPRLPEDSAGKTEDELLKILYSQFYLDELAQSMSRNGYFDEEPLVGVPNNLPREFEQFDIENERDRSRFAEYLKDKNIEFTVVEGNRRLATVKILLNDGLRQTLKVAPSFPTVAGSMADDLRILPVIVYPTRDAVVPYLGVRHIVGIEKWDPYAKARYVAQTVEKLTNEGRSVQDSILEESFEKSIFAFPNLISTKF